MKRIAICTLLLFGSLLLKAQNPGYLGKHFMVYGIAEPSFGYRALNGSPSGRDNIIDANKDAIKVPTGFSFEVPFGIGAEYTLANDLNFGMNFRYMQTVIGIFPHQATVDEELLGYFGEVKNSGTVIGYYIKYYPYYKHGVIAPIGRYHKFEIIQGSMRTSSFGFHSVDSSFQNYYSDQVTLVNSIEQLEPAEFKILMFRYTFGSERVVFDKLVLDIGAQFTINLPYDFNDYFYGRLSSDYGVASQGAIESVAKAFRFGLIINPGFFVF